MCEHEFSRYSIAMLGIRWQCDRCDFIAPPCFEPVPEAITPRQRAKDKALNDLLAEYHI